MSHSGTENCIQAYASQQGLGRALDLRPPTFVETIERQLQQAREEVQRLTELHELLQKNPETQRILELMGRGGLKGF